MNAPVERSEQEAHIPPEMRALRDRMNQLLQQDLDHAQTLESEAQMLEKRAREKREDARLIRDRVRNKEEVYSLVFK